MHNNSEFLERAKEAANAAFDEHCKQWELLQEIAEPTIGGLMKWIDARDTFLKAQDEFESIVRQISGG